MKIILFQDTRDNEKNPLTKDLRNFRLIKIFWKFEAKNWIRAKSAEVIYIVKGQIYQFNKSENGAFEI